LPKGVDYYAKEKGEATVHVDAEDLGEEGNSDGDDDDDNDNEDDEEMTPPPHGTIPPP